VSSYCDFGTYALPLRSFNCTSRTVTDPEGRPDRDRIKDARTEHLTPLVASAAQQAVEADGRASS
jgi:hypothetical protein